MKVQELKATELHRALILQGNSVQEALEIHKSMIQSADEGEDPEELLYEQGLEPDYIFDIINFC